MEHFRGIFCPVMDAISSGSDIKVYQQETQNRTSQRYLLFNEILRPAKGSRVGGATKTKT